MKKIFYACCAVIFIALLAILYEPLIRAGINLYRIGDIKEKIAPHRVNSLEALNKISILGIRKFETDLYWNPGNNNFQVCHDLEQCNSLNLETMLEQAQHAHFIWLDLKNLSEDNAADVASALAKTDRRFNIKKRVVIESSDTSKALAVISRSGFKTAYYLPTRKIIQAADATLAARITAHVVNNNIDNISFDCRGYAFVERELKPLLSAEVGYYVWNTRISYQDKALHRALASDRCLSDSKVRLGLIRFRQ